MHLDFSECLTDNADESATSCSSTLWLNKSRWLFKQPARLSLCLRAFKDARMIHYFIREINIYSIENKEFNIPFGAFMRPSFMGVCAL
jgi:hypothetical protein